MDMRQEISISNFNSRYLPTAGVCPSLFITYITSCSHIVWMNLAPNFHASFWTRGHSCNWALLGFRFCGGVCVCFTFCLKFLTPLLMHSATESPQLLHLSNPSSALFSNHRIMIDGILGQKAMESVSHYHPHVVCSCKDMTLAQHWHSEGKIIFPFTLDRHILSCF